MDNETQAVSTFMNEKHMSIAEGFVSRVIHLLSQESKTVKRYGIEEGYMCENESIALIFEDGIQISITLSRSTL